MELPESAFELSCILGGIFWWYSCWSHPCYNPYLSKNQKDSLICQAGLWQNHNCPVCVGWVAAASLGSCAVTHSVVLKYLAQLHSIDFFFSATQATTSFYTRDVCLSVFYNQFLTNKRGNYTPWVPIKSHYSRFTLQSFSENRVILTFCQWITKDPCSLPKATINWK